MLKKSIYPKTSRLSLNPVIQITEKIDGSNLVFYVVDGKLHIAQRNTVYSLQEFKDGNLDIGVMYKGIHPFLSKYGDDLEKEIFEGSAICGEWLGMGKLNYPSFMENNFRFMAFGKARVDIVNEEVSLNKFNYALDNLHFAFNSQEIPHYIAVVPLVEINYEYDCMNVKYLDKLYDTYVEKAGRNVEGFVINTGAGILKYVRMKNGRLEPHFDKGD